jgi:hypothetical protein
MKHLASVSACIFTVLFVITSCNLLEFEPSGENFIELDGEPKSLFTVSWSNMGDTLVVWDTINISYDVGISVAPVNVVGLVVNNQVVAEAPVGHQIIFNSTTVGDGLYPMQLVALGSSGTGSLMDKLGVEYQLISSSTKYIHIDNGPLGKVDISQFTLNEDGTLTIEWEPYDRPRYGGFYIRDITYCDTEIPRCWGGGSVDTGITSWTDERYDGNEREYVILIWDLRFNGGTSIGNPRKFTGGIPSTQFTEITESGPDKIQLNWSPTAYPKSFAFYLLEMHPLNGEIKGLAHFRDVNQTQFEYEIPLGTKGYIVLSTVTDSYPEIIKFTADSTFVENGRSFIPQNNVTNLVRYLPQFDHYLVLQEDNLMLLDANTLNLIQQIGVFSGSNVHFRMSNDQNSFVMVQGPQVKIVSTENLAVLHDFHVGNHYPGLSNIQLTHPIIDDVNQLWINMGQDIGTKILNLNTMQKIDYKIPAGTNHFISAIHPDGTRILGSLPSISGSGLMNQYSLHPIDQVELVRNFDPNYSPKADYSRDGSIVFTTDGYTKVIGSDVHNHSEVMNFDLPWITEESLQLDVIQNIYYYRNLENGRFEIRSLDDGSMLHQFSMDQFQILLDIRFEHEIVWFQNGMYQFINELN